MAERLTGDLIERLRTTGSLDAFCAEEPADRTTLPERLSALLRSKGLTRSQVIRDARLNTTFGYQIFAGERNPGRDKVLQLAFAMRCTPKECQRLLHDAGDAALYVKSRRDAIVFFCLDHGMTLEQADDELFRFGERTITDPE